MRQEQKGRKNTGTKQVERGEDGLCEKVQEEGDFYFFIFFMARCIFFGAVLEGQSALFALTFTGLTCTAGSSVLQFVVLIHPDEPGGTLSLMLVCL